MHVILKNQLIKSIVYCLASRSIIFLIIQEFDDCWYRSATSRPSILLRACIPLSRHGSLSCPTCYDTGPRFPRSHFKDSPFWSLHISNRVSEDLF